MISACILPCSVHASVSSAPVNYSCKLLITLTPGVRVWNDLGLQITAGATVISACILSCSVLASLLVYSATPVNYSCKLLITLTPGVSFLNERGLHVTTEVSCCDIYVHITMQCPCFCPGLFCHSCKLQL